MQTRQGLCREDGHSKIALGRLRLPAEWPRPPLTAVPAEAFGCPPLSRSISCATASSTVLAAIALCLLSALEEHAQHVPTTLRIVYRPTRTRIRATERTNTIPSRNHMMVVLTSPAPAPCDETCVAGAQPKNLNRSTQC